MKICEVHIFIFTKFPTLLLLAIISKTHVRHAIKSSNFSGYFVIVAFYWRLHISKLVEDNCWRYSSPNMFNALYLENISRYRVVVNGPFTGNHIQWVESLESNGHATDNVTQPLDQDRDPWGQHQHWDRRRLPRNVFLYRHKTNKRTKICCVCLYVNANSKHFTHWWCSYKWC